MKCYCMENEHGFYYVVDHADETYHTLIEKAFFGKENDKFIKWYPVDMPDKDIVTPNFERLAPKIYVSAIDSFLVGCNQRGLHS